MSFTSNRRRLVAILAADVAGYTRLVEEDTDGTVAAWKSARDDMITPGVAENSGHIIKFTGDGFLVEFASVLDAVNCAISLQEKLTSSPLKFRMGVNLGDIMDDGGDVHGEGVNIAARIEAFAKPGGINITGDVYNQIRNRIEHEFEDIGRHQVKHVTTPVQVYRILLGDQKPEPKYRTVFATRWLAVSTAMVLISGLVASSWWWQMGEPIPEPVDVAIQTGVASDIPSIAVLPFTNLSGDQQQQYLADGMADDLITDLSKISGLFVIARNSSFSFKGKYSDVKQTARELGVKYILEGSVRRFGDQIRINTQLVDGLSGGHVWAERYDENTGNIFALQDRVAREIIAALKIKLTIGDEETLEHRPRPVNLEAYEWLLKGRRELATLDRSRAAKAREYFERSIKADPTYARAFSNLGLYYWREWRVWGRDKKNNLEKAKTVGRQAVDLDQQSAVAAALLAVTHQTDGEHLEADNWGSTALRLKPTQAETLGNLGAYLLHAGRYDEAITIFSKAIHLDPQHPPIWISWLGHAYFMVGETGKSIEILKQGIARGPDYIAYHLFLAANYASRNELEEANQQVEKVLGLNSGFTVSAYKRYALSNTKSKSAVDQVITALRKAGMPE